jgi:hypothetical protein
MGEHKNISDSVDHTHLPQGFTAASNGTSPRKNGSGNLVWTSLPYGEMRVVNNSTAISLTAASDSTLNTDSDYTKVTASGLWTTGQLKDFTFDSSGYLLSPANGIYILSFWASFTISVINTNVAFKFSTDDTNSNLSERKVSRLSGSSGDRGNVGATGLTPSLALNDKLSMWVAADKNCNLTIIDGGLTAILLQET